MSNHLVRVRLSLSCFLLPTLFLAAQSESPLREKEILRFREEVRRMVDANDTLGLLAQNRSDGESLVSALKKSPRTPEDLNFLKARYQEMQESVNYYLDQMANDIAAIGGTDDDANNFFTFQKMLKRHYAGNYEKALSDYQMFMRYAHGPGEVPFFPPIAIHVCREMPLPKKPLSWWKPSGVGSLGIGGIFDKANQINQYSRQKIDPLF